MSIKDLFDVSSLEEHDLGHIEWVLNSPSYGTVFRPFMERAQQSAINLLLDRTEERRKRWSDEALAERANAIRELIVFFDNLVKESQQERILRAQAALNDPTDYDKVAQAGLLDARPGNSGYVEIPPEEDF